MKYFIVEDSLDEKVVGKDFPQAYKFIKGYNPDAPNMLFSIYKYRESFPDYIPDLDGIMLSGSAKLTNIVSNGFSPFFFIIDERVKQLLEQYKLCPHRFYPLGLYKRKVKYNYFLLYIVSNYIDYVDCAKTSFIEYNIASGKKKGYTQTIWGNRIVMNDQFDSELDFFTITRIDGRQYISERLKNAIEANGLTGWVFTPATNLVVE